MLREGRVERVEMKQRASTTSLEDVARLQKQSEELEKVCATAAWDRALHLIRLVRDIAKFCLRPVPKFFQFDIGQWLICPLL